MVIHKSFADFVLFLYIHMAHADGDYHTSEEKVILNKMEKLFQEQEIARKLEAALREYGTLSQDMIPQIIRQTFKHFKDITLSQKYEVYNDLYEIIHADGKVDESETHTLNELKEVIEMGASWNLR
jgi:uncharacterized tellurite resistance protein B-like protein